MAYVQLKKWIAPSPPADKTASKVIQLFFGPVNNNFERPNKKSKTNQMMQKIKQHLKRKKKLNDFSQIALY